MELENRRNGRDTAYIEIVQYEGRKRGKGGTDKRSVGGGCRSLTRGTESNADSVVAGEGEMSAEAIWRKKM
jgi:hypothetical protein